MATKSKGRQKIVMAKMREESNLRVTFSKWCSGSFKKASELSTLCGVEIVIVVFSPMKRVFSFGHPNVEQIFDKFIDAQNPSPTNSTSLQLVQALHSARARLLNTQLCELLHHLEEQKQQREEIKKLRKQGQDMFWWEAPVDDLGFEQLDMLKREIKDQTSSEACNDAGSTGTRWV
ncbi:agamous-like MADS-box protein AGL62 [Daucus carota subsp. sativus]|uniref:agamous-like MADS-box protein AGL62 n=1 Tax=Daucus carota subsp. sativus TaxID=79200 RepID=UPI0007EF454D|nr:PREDICTED: agamous-like MADS-box protein AGL62 [Daucus carota subsp. sativus]